MKELSIEEKAKRYESALEKCRKLYNEAKANEYTPDMEDYETIFPELRESDDERIRKALIDGFTVMKESKNCGKTFSNHNILVEDILSWLEKQGEQKPADKIEPKFQNGQWIVWQNKCYKVNYNGCGYELVDQNGLSTSLEYGTVEESAHLWGITKDAKDGDVLVYKSGKRPFIFKGLLDSFHPNCPVAYCGICADDLFQLSSGDGWWTGEEVFPATKGQREQLLKAMADAGYTFDFDKKKLKKIEQKPNNKVDLATKSHVTPNSEFFQWIYDRLIYVHHENPDVDYMHSLKERIEDMQKTAWSEEDEEQFSFCCAAIELSNYSSEEYRNYAISFLESLKDRVQPKQEWSEEDEKILRTIISDGIRGAEFDMLQINWLKFLKDRVQPQPKQEWSEEDETRLNSTIKHLEEHEGDTPSPLKPYIWEDIKWLKSLRPQKQEWGEEDDEQLSNAIFFVREYQIPTRDKKLLEAAKKAEEWLESLRQQNTWKPSDEQMGVIEAVINNRSFQRRHLDSLYADLKKLKG